MLTVLRHSQPNVWTSECRVATGRSAILHLINITAPRAVLMPCYVPEGVIGPFQRAGVPIKFYKLRNDLRPDLDHLEKTICRGAIVIIIHYFGYQTETGAIREIVSNADGILFEDCAHALFAKAPDADVALWSLNKFLPVVDGAILRSKRRDIDVTNFEQASLPQRTMNAYHQHLQLNSRISKCPAPQVFDLAQESNLAYEEYYKEIQNLTIYAQSTESKCIEANTDLENVRTVRSHNAATYYKNIPARFTLRPKAPLAPFAFPIVIKPPVECDDVFKRLVDVGVLASDLVDKWNHVPKDDKRFLIEQSFMKQHLLLPVGEEVTYDNVMEISACLKEFANGHRDNC